MIKHIHLLLAFGLLAPALHSRAQTTQTAPPGQPAPPAAIIPKPVSTQWHDGQFLLSSHSVLVTDGSEEASAKFFNDYLEQFYGFHLHISKNGQPPANNYVLLQTRPAS